MNSTPPAQSLAGRRPPARQPEPLTSESKRLDKLDADQFEKKGKDLSVPTLTRPALITTAEVDNIRTTYTTGAGRLDVINKVTNKRLDFYTEAHGGGAPFDPISDGDRAKCQAFFEAHGTRLANQPRVAPDNPLKPKPDAAQLIEQAKVDLKPAAPPAADPAHVAADKAIVEAEAARPKPPVILAPAAPPAHLAHVDIVFKDALGFIDTITIYPSTTGEQIGALLKQAATLRQQLHSAGATAPEPAPAAAAPAAGHSEDNPPKCKYHGAMKPSKKPGAWYCPKKLGDGSYCDQKVGE